MKPFVLFVVSTSVVLSGCVYSTSPEYSFTSAEAFLGTEREIGELLHWKLSPEDGEKPLETVASIRVQATPRQDQFSYTTLNVRGAGITANIRRIGKVEGTFDYAAQATVNDLEVLELRDAQAVQTIKEAYGAAVTAARKDGRADTFKPWAADTVVNNDDLYVLVSAVQFVSEASVVLTPGSGKVTVEADRYKDKLFEVSLDREVAFRCSGSNGIKGRCLFKVYVFDPYFSDPKNEASGVSKLRWKKTEAYSKKELSKAFRATFLD